MNLLLKGIFDFFINKKNQENLNFNESDFLIKQSSV